MATESTIQLVNQIFIDKFELDASALTPDKKLFDDLELDSLDIVDLVSGLQHSLGISLRDNKELLQIRTLQDVYELVEKLLAEHPELKDMARK